MERTRQKNKKQKTLTKNTGEEKNKQQQSGDWQQERQKAITEGAGNPIRPPSKHTRAIRRIDNF